MKRLFLFLLLSPLAFGQGYFPASQLALKTVNGNTSPLANAVITVCAKNTSGIPCSPVLTNTIFSDSALTQALSNPFQADANGNYIFAAAPGQYTVTVTGTGFAGYSYQAIVGAFASAPGVFTSTQMNEYLTSVIGSCNTHSVVTGSHFFGLNFTDAISGCVNSPNGATANTAAILGAAVSNTNGSPGVETGVFVANANANDTFAVGEESVSYDSVNAAWINLELIGGVFGVSSNNGSAAATYEILDGIESTAVFANQPALVWTDGITEIGNALSIGSGNANQWNRGVLIGPGAATIGVEVNGMCTLGGGHNCSSAAVEFSGVKAGVRGNFSGVQGDNNGNLLVITQSGSGLQINSAVRLFSTLPSCTSGLESLTAPISDSTTNAWGATITGGGANHVLAYCDGTNWTVMAK